MGNVESARVVVVYALLHSLMESGFLSPKQFRAVSCVNGIKHCLSPWVVVLTDTGEKNPCPKYVQCFLRIDYWPFYRRKNSKQFAAKYVSTFRGWCCNGVSEFISVTRIWTLCRGLSCWAGAQVWSPCIAPISWLFCLWIHYITKC